MRDSMVFYRSFFEAIKDLNFEQQGIIFNAIFDYGLNFKEPKLDGICKTIWTLIKPQLDANIKKFHNGKQPKEKQNISKTEANNKQNRSKTQANVNANVNVNDNVRIDISLTTLSLVEKIFLEKTAYNWTESYAKKEAEKFYNFYASKGWKVGKEKMKSLPHAIGGWISRNDKPETVNAPKEETEREYRLRMFNERNGL
jgi:hypothetical protein